MVSTTESFNTEVEFGIFLSSIQDSILSHDFNKKFCVTTSQIKTLFFYRSGHPVDAAVSVINILSR